MEDANISPTSDQTLPTTPLLADSWSWLENVTAAPAGILIILFLLLSVSLGTLFNFIMARTAFLYRKKSMYKFTSHLLITLGMVDFLYTATQGFQIIYYFLAGKAMTESCGILATFGLFLVLTEQLIFCWLIMERINSVFRPIEHHLMCPGRKTWVDLVCITTISLTFSILVAYLTGTQFCPYRGRCWVKKSSTHHTLVTLLLTLSGLLPLLLALLLLARVMCLQHTNSRALSTLGSMVLVYFLSTYSEITILFLNGASKGEARRYCLALDSIVTLLSRSLSPVIYSYSLKDFTFFCLSYVDDNLFRPVFKGVAMLKVRVRVTVRRVQGARIRLPEFVLLSDATRARAASQTETTL